MLPCELNSQLAPIWISRCPTMLDTFIYMQKPYLISNMAVHVYFHVLLHMLCMYNSEYINKYMDTSKTCSKLKNKQQIIMQKIRIHLKKKTADS